MSRESIKLINAALALDENDGKSIILRGELTPESLRLLQTAPYQREIISGSKIRDLVGAYDSRSVPDIELGMRGGDCRGSNGVHYLHDDVFIIDGLQRVTAARQYALQGKIPRLGAVVYFNTTEEWERTRFRILNTMRTKLSPNVLIRNMQHEYSVIDMLIMLDKDSSFALRGRICWEQSMKRSELVSALTLVRSVSMLHSHITPGRNTQLMLFIPNLQKMYDKIGRNVFRDNIKTFWAMLEECFTVRNIGYKEESAHLRTSFLYALSMILSDHTNFWRDSRLFIEKDLIRKIHLFKIHDPYIKRLCASGAGSRTELYDKLLAHINKGKKSKRLINRYGNTTIRKEESDDTLDDQEEQ